MTDSFLKYLQFEKRVSTHTVLAYQKDLEQFQAFLTQSCEGTEAGAAEYSMIRMWIVALVESGLQPRSINRKIACLRSYFKYLLRRESIANDPMIKIRILKTRKTLPSFMKESEMIKLLDQNEDGVAGEETFESVRDRLILELFYCTGIRLSELIGLQISKIDLRSQTIRVIGKRNKERVIPFPNSLGTLIKNYQAVRKKTVDSKSSDRLLVTENGDPCYPMLIYRIVRKYLDRVSTSDKRSPHVLRHTYATHLLNKGAEINAVKDLLGHSSLAATQVYTHNSMEKLKKVFDQAHPKA
jgi:integrase/recombinase XerC